MLARWLLFVSVIVVLPLALLSLEWLLPFRGIRPIVSIALMMFAGWAMIAFALGTTKLNWTEFLVSTTVLLPLGGGIVISRILFLFDGVMINSQRITAVLYVLCLAGFLGYRIIDSIKNKQKLG